MRCDFSIRDGRIEGANGEGEGYGGSLHGEGRLSQSNPQSRPQGTSNILSSLFLSTRR